MPSGLEKISGLENGSLGDPSKWLKNPKSDSSGASQGKKDKDKDKKDKNSQDIQCHECSWFGHIRAKCPNYKKSKGKAINVTLSDELDSDDFDKAIDKKGNYVTTTTSTRSGSGSSVDDTLDHKESSTYDCDEEVDLQVAYKKLFKECTKSLRRCIACLGLHLVSYSSALEHVICIFIFHCIGFVLVCFSVLLSFRFFFLIQK